MFNTRYYRFLLVKLIAIFLIGFGQNALAVDVKLSSFVLYELGNKRLMVDGVSTKYGLGVVGLDVAASLPYKLNISGRFGYGFNPKQNISFSGANFEGPVTGTYLGAKVQYELWAKDDYSVSSEFSIVNRHIRAPDLTGSRSGRVLDGEAVNDLNSQDLLLAAQIPLGSSATMTVAGGLSRWHLKSKAKAVYTSSRGSATARKNIDVVGQDPIFKVSIITNNPKHNFELELSNRSLKSKTENNTQIRALQLVYDLRF